MSTPSVLSRAPRRQVTLSPCRAGPGDNAHRTAIRRRSKGVAGVGRRLGGHEWPVMVSTVHLGRHRYRVMRPARPPGFAGLYEGPLGAQFCLDKETATLFALAWGLAARSPHTMVYLPLRRATRPHHHSWGARSTWCCCITASRSRRRGGSRSVPGWGPAGHTPWCYPLRRGRRG